MTRPGEGPLTPAAAHAQVAAFIDKPEHTTGKPDQVAATTVDAINDPKHQKVTPQQPGWTQAGDTWHLEGEEKITY